MRVMKYETLPFPGWPAFIDQIREIGAFTVIRLLVALSWKDFKTADNFTGSNPIHHAHNHQALCHVALRVWMDEGTPAMQRAPVVEDARRLTILLLQMGDIVHQGFIDRPRMTSKKNRRRQVAETMWVSALQMRHRNSRSMDEAGRTWLLLREYWSRRQYDVMAREEQRKGETPPKEPMLCGFDSLEWWVFAAFSVLTKDGWIEDPAAYYASTAFAENISAQIDMNLPSVEEVIGPWDDVRHQVRNSLLNPFMEHPILRIPGGPIIAPDPAAVFSALSDRVIRRVRDRGCADESERQKERIATLIGYSYESYVADLVKDCGEHSVDERFQAEFTVGSNGEERSPDAFLNASNHVTMFEVKSTRVPEPPDCVANLLGLLSMMEAASGKRRLGSRTRGPLEQGTDFIRRWDESDPRILENLGNMPPSCLYVLVSPIEWPGVIHWGQFREQFWHPLLGDAEKFLDGRVAFVNHRELELAAILLRARMTQGKPTSFRVLLEEWMTATRKYIVELDSNSEIRDVYGGFGDYLLSHYAEEMSQRLPMLDNAAEEIVYEAGRIAFPEDVSRDSWNSYKQKRQQDVG